MNPGWRSKRSSGQSYQSAAEVLCYLTPDLVDLLADLHGSPEALAQATVQLLPFGSRAALQATGLAIACDSSAEDSSDRGIGSDGRIELTPLAFAVMAVAADRHEYQDISALSENIRALACQQANEC